MSILRSFGIQDDHFKGIFSRIHLVAELEESMSSRSVPAATIEHAVTLYLQIPPENYLLVWNPEAWEWREFQEDYEVFLRDGELVRKWGCGNTKKIRAGDNVYFIKLGPESPRGIMGSGQVIEGSHADDHWSGEAGRQGLYIRVKFDTLIDYRLQPDLMVLENVLKTDPILREYNWSPMASGVSIRPEIAEALRKIFNSATIENLNQIYKPLMLPEVFKEGRLVQKLSTRYERDSRARRRCLEIHGFDCKACGISMEKRYGRIGCGFIEVHHLVPIAAREGREYRINPEVDLVPLCPNCHSMIHKLGPSASVCELKSHLAEALTQIPGSEVTPFLR